MHTESYQLNLSITIILLPLRRNPLYGLIYNPVYNNRRIETTASGGQLQDSHDHAYEIISSACYCEGTPTQ